MKNFLNLSLIGLTIISLCACEQNQSTTVASAVAQIVSFGFAEDDSIPGLGEAVFVVEELTDTGLIRMRKNDSIRYGTDLSAVIPEITYYTTPSSVIFYLGDSAVSLTGYDTLNLAFNNDSTPILIHVTAQDVNYSKWYRLRFDVHTMDGDLFKWDEPLYIEGAPEHGTQKAMLHKDVMYYFQSDGFTPRLFTSSDLGKQWEIATVTGLPKDCNVRQIVEGDQYFFYGRGKDFYYSEDGAEWNHVPLDTLDIMALYMCMNVKNMYQKDDSIRIWMAARSTTDGKARFYTVGKSGEAVTPMVARGIGLPGDTLPVHFPIEDFATIPFQSSSYHQHGLIAGGYDRNHQMTNARWNLEYNYIYDSYHLTDMASGYSGFPDFTGTSVCYYNNYMYLLGGIYENRNYICNAFVSEDEGVHWVEVNDSTNMKRPDAFKGRYHTNTFVYKGTDLYIIGGEDNSTTYSDIYRGRQNSAGWEPIGN